MRIEVTPGLAIHSAWKTISSGKALAVVIKASFKGTLKLSGGGGGGGRGKNGKCKPVLPSFVDDPVSKNPLAKPKTLEAWNPADARFQTQPPPPLPCPGTNQQCCRYSLPNSRIYNQLRAAFVMSLVQTKVITINEEGKLEVGDLWLHECKCRESICIALGSI